MLVLSRLIGERVVLTGGIVVTLVEIRGNKARLGFEAPAEINIAREELLVDAKCLESRESEGETTK